MANKFFENFVNLIIGRSPSDRQDLPIVEKKDEIVEKFESNGSSIDSFYPATQLAAFRQIAQDRDQQYDAYDEMATDSVIAAALEIYADDATQEDEKGRVIWVESEDEEIMRAGNRLLKILEIPDRAWKHIYMACKYGDFYLKLYRRNAEGDFDEEEYEDDISTSKNKSTYSTRIVNDKREYKNDKVFIPQYLEYCEDVPDPATIFDLRRRGKCAGFVEVKVDHNNENLALNTFKTYSIEDCKVYRPDRFIHISISETLSRQKEGITLDIDGSQVTYDVNRGKSILYDVYPIQKELQLLEDSLLLNRLTRSSLIRMLEIEVGDMPKKEANDYLRRIKNLIEQHISLDKTTGDYKSFNAPGPIDNVIYIPVKNGRGHIDINNLGGDVNVRDLADIDYFNNKRAGALKIPRSYLGDDSEGSGFDNGGTLTKLSARYARTVKRIQRSYIRAITQLLNLFFLDKKLDYINKFEVRMTSPSTQEDLERNELINGNLELVGNIMELMGSLEGDTQKKILENLFREVMKMPELAEMIKEDMTPEEDISIDGSGITGGGGSDLDIDIGGAPESGGEGPDLDFGSDEGPSAGGEEGGFTNAEFSEFEDEI